jgi:hypothetical protein
MLSRAAWSRRESEKTGPRKQYHHPTDKHLAKAKKLLADIRRLYGEGKGELIPTLPEGAGRKCGCFQFIRFGLCSDEEDCMNDDKAFQILRDAVDVKEAGDRIADATESPCGLAGTTATRERAAQRAIGRRPVFKVFLEQRLRRMEVNQELILHGQRTGLHGQRAILFGQQTILAKLAIQATAMERITATMCNRSAQ